MATVLVVHLYHVWYEARVEVPEQPDGSIDPDDVWEAREEQDPLFTEIEREFRDSYWGRE